MRTESFIRRSPIAASPELAFAWHSRVGAFERITPPWEPVRVLFDTGGIEDGGRKEMRIIVGPFWRTWVAEYHNYVAGRQFQDVQTTGPFAEWVHTHKIDADGPDRCFLEDDIRYVFPLGGLGRLLAGPMVRRRIARTFAYRHRVTSDDLRALQRYKERAAMKVLVSGPNGLVGTALRYFLSAGGNQVVGLTRSKPDANNIQWDPSAGKLAGESLRGFDAVVHLAGESIAAGRWTDAIKARIRNSRVEGTRLLCEKLAALDVPPKVLVCASAIGIYGDRGDETLDESSSPGNDFLAGVCREWEAACEPARQRGIRVVNLRLGVVLSTAGGALAKMLLPFKLGAGGVVGSGKQYWSWVALDDVIGAVHHALMHDELSGPVNATAPTPATNREFTKTLGSVLHRPTLFPMPAPVARLLLGEMADALLLASAKVLPTKLTQTGYDFRYPELAEALRHVLGK